MTAAKSLPVVLDSSKKPPILTGALVGLLLTLPMMAIFFLGDQLVGLPFVPFDVFDWVSRHLPGPLLTFGIDTMVSIIRGLNLGETSSTAKLAEQLIALGGFLAIGVIAGAALFAVSRQLKAPMGYIPGLVMGCLVGVLMAAISLDVNLTASAAPLVSVVWILLVFVGWGAAYSWLYNDLSVSISTAVGASAEQIDRRSFLVRVGGAAAVITVVGTGAGVLLGRREEPAAEAALPSTETAAATDGTGDPLPNADAAVKPAPGTRPEYTPLDQHYRIDISARPPVIDGETWSMPIKGLAENPMAFTLEDLRTKYEPMDQYVTLACISNPIAGDLISTTRWTGVSLQKIMADVKPKPEATFLKITAADGFDEYVSLDLINADERVMLAYAWDGQPLREKHGFPLRIYIPDRYGMKQPKWITEIELVEQWEEGYWVRRSWSREAIMNATSVIDTVAVNSLIEDGSSILVPIGGIAHAGARGISKVEVKVDDGEWVEAQLRDPISQTTWTIWRYDWPFAEGNHTFAVRCVDGSGEAQIETVRGVRPDGATGIHSVRRFVETKTST